MCMDYWMANHNGEHADIKAAWTAIEAYHAAIKIAGDPRPEGTLPLGRGYLYCTACDTTYYGTEAEHLAKVHPHLAPPLD